MPAENEVNLYPSSELGQGRTVKELGSERLDCGRLPEKEVEKADAGSLVSQVIGHQIELESDSAIQYRTCSWQKVKTHPLTSNFLC